MTPEHWQKIKSILENALELPPELRSVFLAKSCRNNTDLQREVEELLKFEESEEGLLDQEAASVILENSNQKNLVNQQIGNYKIIGELGTGGMGAVYYATRADGEFQQKVALKLIKRGMDSDAVLQRFITERQILASLEHQNIAHLIDGGTTKDGLPYFVMEYVEGVSILQYADDRNLDLNERLNLFREVCSAVSFAHQNLVIHRDLKPSNILITNDGKVKLLDFGIAKLLKSETENQTATQMRVFTPEYASPEQVLGEKLTTATDIYSLGVILYELLTGNRPYKTESKNISEIIKAVCETEPVRPSSVVSGQWSVVRNTSKNKGQKTHIKGQILNPQSAIRNLKGDLDNIILKSLCKEPERRYSSVEQFSDDIHRHQTGLPVTASGDTWNYRATKFIRRNQIGVAAAALILISLLGGIFATLYQRNKAQRRFNDVRQIANSFLFEFHDAIENLPGSTPARELVVKRAVEYLDKLAAESEGDAALQNDLGTAYERIGKIQGNSYYSNIGDTDGATQSYQKSLEIRQKLANNNPTDIETQYNLARGHRGIGDMLYTNNDLQGGLQSYQKSVAILEKIVDADPENLLYLNLYADVLSRIGDVKGMEGFANLGDTQGALESYRRVEQVNGKLVEKEPENKEYAGDYATRLIYLGRLQSATGDIKGAIESCQKAIAILEKLASAEPEHAGFETRLVIASNVLRSALLEDGREAEAVENARQTIDRMKQLVAKDPKNIQIKRGLSVTYNSFGRAQFQMNDYRGAIQTYRQSLLNSDEISAAYPQNAENKNDILLAKQLLAKSQSAAGDRETALKLFRETITGIETVLKTDDANFQIKDDLSVCLVETGKILTAKGDLTNAAEYFRRALSLAEESLQKNPNNIRVKSNYANHYFEAGKTFAKLSAAENSETIKAEACSYLDRSFAVWNEMKNSNTLSVTNNNSFNETLKELGSCKNK